MARTEAQILAETMDKTRQLARYYISRLRDVDPFSPLDLGGVKFNSLYWLTAHMLWAEDNLIVVGTGGKTVAPAWAAHYCIGGDGTLHEGHGDYKSLLDEMKKVHESAISYLSSLTDEMLAEDNPLGVQFGDGDRSMRMMVMHAIRHEGTHIGNLAWMNKMYGVKTI
jgi:uncharacterized damage-inducible protein DinB